MADETPNTAEQNGDDSKRKAIANRQWLKLSADGKSYDEVAEEEATHVGYTYKADGQSYVHKLSAPGTLAGMLEGFGALTLMGNITNTWKGEEGERSASPIEDITARFKLMGEGKWIDRTSSGFGGPRYDKMALAETLVQVLGKAAKGDAAAYLKRIEEEKGYGAKALKNPDVLRAYGEKVGKSAPAMADLA